MDRMIQRLRQPELDLARDAAQHVVEIHRRLADWLRCGVTLARIDTFVAQQLKDLSCKSCFLGYRSGRLPPFPSYACLSPNDCIVHGTSGFISTPMRPGDILSIDLGVSCQGWIGDAAWTYVFKEMDDSHRRLVTAGKESISAGIAELRPGRPFINFARAVQQCVERKHGLYCVRGLGGHGYGRTLHAPPFIANTAPLHPSEWPDAFTKAQPGMLIAVEPMIAVGSDQIAQKPREWPIYTADGSLSVHYEHDIYIDIDGPVVLTKGLDDLPDIVG